MDQKEPKKERSVWATGALIGIVLTLLITLYNVITFIKYPAELVAAVTLGVAWYFMICWLGATLCVWIYRKFLRKKL